MSFDPLCLAAAVGSFPHKNAEEALDLIFQRFPEIPVWPQLPRLGFRENMYVQFSEKLPCAVLDESAGCLHFDTGGDIYGPLESFFERVVLEDVDFFETAQPFAAGFHAFIDRLTREKPETVRCVKGQVTGPISFGLTITDQGKRAIMYHPELYEAILKGCVMSARWQVRKLKTVHPQVLIFMDEPYLSAFGSAFINLSREQVVSNLSELAEGIHQEGGLVGIHCCGNTDWSILMDVPIDVLNFDAYEFFQGLTLYPESLARFVDRGGTLAWGIVPSSDAAEGESVDSLRARFGEGLELLAGKGIDRDRLVRQCLITPSCGMGGRTVELAKRITMLTAELAASLREKHALYR
ncbi:MAG: hypothetical protein KAW17_12310 [Candidatus Eisenbacteria sp.]|nr:hypothetical protein [Candidatus Eisenbacteria bacterium]